MRDAIAHPGLDDSPGDARHRPEAALARLLTTRVWPCAACDDLNLRSRGAASRRMGHGRTGDTLHRPRGAFARALHLTSPSRKTEGTGKAGWPHEPGAPAQRKFARARKPQVQAVTTGLPCVVVYGLYALPGEPSRLPPSSARCLSIVANLSARPWGARTTRLRRPRACRSSIGTPRVHRIPLHVRDDRDTSLDSVAERGEQTPCSVKTNDKYFCAEDWTAQISLNGHPKFDFSRMRFLPIGMVRGRPGKGNSTDFARRANRLPVRNNCLDPRLTGSVPLPEV